MILTATQILEEGLVIPSEFGKPAQVGYDLSLKSVKELLKASIGAVHIDKTEIGESSIVEFREGWKFGSPNNQKAWRLEPGIYDFTFNEGCNISNNRMAFIKQRSSLMRNGAMIQSSLFDPGFKTENIGTICIVNKTIYIEQNARVAQIYFHECMPVEDKNLYNGQFQGDYYRKENNQ